LWRAGGFFFSSRRRHTRFSRDWSSDVCSSDLDVENMELSLPDLSRISRIYASSGELLAELHDGRNSQPVRYQDIPETVVQAVLAAEDKDFFEHDGIDFEAIASAAADSISGNLRGGSTITQQV